MGEPRLDGVLAIRETWCRPGEPILLCAAGTHTNTRFDVAGLDGRGRPQPGLGRQALRAVDGAASMIDAMGGPRDSVAPPPYVIIFAGRPDALTPRIGATAGRPETSGWWVLTPVRLAWVTVAAATPVTPATGADRSVLGQVRGFARGARAAFADREAYPPNRPVPTVSMITGAEVPRDQITGVTVANRTLPREFGGHQVGALRIGLADGSGIDFVGGREPAHAQRLLDMVNGQR